MSKPIPTFRSEMSSGGAAVVSAFGAAAASAAAHMQDYATARGIERQNRATMEAAIRRTTARAQARHDAYVAALRAELAKLTRT